ADSVFQKIAFPSAQHRSETQVVVFKIIGAEYGVKTTYFLDLFCVKEGVCPGDKMSLVARIGGVFLDSKYRSSEKYTGCLGVCAFINRFPHHGESIGLPESIEALADIGPGEFDIAIQYEGLLTFCSHDTSVAR